MAYLDIENVVFNYDNGPVLNDLTISIESGEMVGILGPNGSGKTTLIKLISGVLRPKQGKVRFDNTDLAKISRKSAAQQIAVVPQEFDVPFAFTAAEVIMLGRTPFHSLFDTENGKDREIIERVIGTCGIAEIAERRFNELSGGEKQKVILATALAQEPRLLLMDEPTVHLDIAHQVEILEQVRNLNRISGITVIAAMHDLNLAAMYFDRLIFLKQGKILADGTPSEVLTEGNIRETFDTGVRVAEDPATGTPHIFVLPPSLTVEGKNYPETRR